MIVTLSALPHFFLFQIVMIIIYIFINMRKLPCVKKIWLRKVHTEYALKFTVIVALFILFFIL